MCTVASNSQRGRNAAARRLGVSAKPVSRWISGATEPRLRDLSRIRDAFGELPFP